MKLIDDWRQSWRFDSVRAAALLLVLSLVQAEVLPAIQFAVPARYWPWVTAGFAIAIMLLRVRAQLGLLAAKPEKGSGP